MIVVITRTLLQKKNILNPDAEDWILSELNTSELEVKSETSSPFSLQVKSKVGKSVLKVRSFRALRTIERHSKWRVGVVGRLLHLSPPPRSSPTMSSNSPWLVTQRLDYNYLPNILLIFFRRCQVWSSPPMENGLPAAVQTSWSKYGVSLAFFKL